MANHDATADARSKPSDDSRRNGKRRAEDEPQDDLPQPYNASQLQSVKRRAVSPSDQPRKQKRPGARARLSQSERDAIRERQLDRERQAAADEAAAVERHRQRGINDVVRQHYNSVPERGREWRTTDSKIKGLRVFNNWVKSCIIQRYSPDEDHTPGSREMGRSSGNELLVLDIGCGKGGDLNKWQQAPQPIQLYVGLDPADVSIDQARDRYRSMQRGGGRGGRGGYRDRRPPPRIFDGRFAVKDCYNETIEDLEIIRQVGFDPSPMNKRGFDVVSMMFSMHYAFESEKNARTMLRNVAGALKKGGRFIGCIPNSDVLGERVRQFNEKMAAKKKASEPERNQEEKPKDEKKDEANGPADRDSPPHHLGSPPHLAPSPPHFAESPPHHPESPPHFADSPPHHPQSPTADATVAPATGADDRKDPQTTEANKGEGEEGGAAPTKGADDSKEPQTADTDEGEIEEGEAEPTAEWGNSIYRVRFPGPTPHDGIFRPAFGWKYNFFLDEAVEEVPEYVVPWEAFRALADDYNLELQFHRTFPEVWDNEKDDPDMGPLSERMGVRGRGRGELLVSDEEMEAASFYIGFCFYKV